MPLHVMSLPKQHSSLFVACCFLSKHKHGNNARICGTALAFRGIGIFEVGMAVFLGRLGYLVDHMVPTGPLAAKSREDLMDIMRRRLRPVLL